MTLASRYLYGLGASSRFRPTQLGNNVLWLDMLERHSYSPVAGVGGALPTIQSITNLVSGVAWTEGSLPPFYEARGLGGRPCLLNPIGDTRRIMSTEAAVFGAFNGDDQPFTMFLAVEQLSSATTAAFFATGTAGVNSSNNSCTFGRLSGLPRMVRTDGAGAAMSVGSTFIQPGPQVLAWRFDGTNVSVWTRAGLPPAASAPASIGTIAADRSALFLHPDLSPGSNMVARIGAAVAYNAALSDSDTNRVLEWLRARWLFGTTSPNDIANRTCWLHSLVSFSGEVVGWNGHADFSPVNTFSFVSGKGPSTNGEHFAQCIDFESANSDLLFNNNALSDTGALTLGIVWKLDALPAAGQAVTLCSPKMHDSNDDWFEVVLAHDVSGTKTISFARQNGLAGTYQGFDIELADSAQDGLDGGVHRLIVTYDGATYTARYDGATQTVAASGPWTRATGDKGSLGARVSSADATSQGIDGKLLRFVTHERVLTAAEVEQLDLYLASEWRFSPDFLPNLKLWFDLQDASSYELTGSTVTSIRNKASNVLWTEATNPPTYEAAGFNGLPCLKFDGVDDHITSTEAAVFGAVDGTDAPFTVYVVMQPIGLNNDQAWIGFGNSGTSIGDQLNIGFEPGQQTHYLDRSGGGSSAPSAFIALEPHVFCWSCAGATASGYLHDGPADPSADPNTGTIAPNRTSLGRVPSSSPHSFGNYRLAEALLYEGGHSEADVRAVARYLAQKWDMGLNPRTIPGLVGWWDLSQSSFYTITNGTITSLKNLVSNIAATQAEATAPLFEATAFNGRPCMRGLVSASRKLVGTDTDLQNALADAGDEFEVILVTDVIEAITTGTQSFFSVGSAVESSEHMGAQLTAVSGTARYRIVKTDTGVTTQFRTGAIVTTGPQVLQFSRSASVKRIARNLEAAFSFSQDDYNAAAGLTAASQYKFFEDADQNGGANSNNRIAEALVFSRTITDLERTRLVAHLMAKWGIT